MRIAFQGLVFGLGILVGNPLGSAYGNQGLQDGVVSGAGSMQ